MYKIYYTVNLLFYNLLLPSSIGEPFQEKTKLVELDKVCNIVPTNISAGVNTTFDQEPLGSYNCFTSHIRTIYMPAIFRFSIANPLNKPSSYSMFTYKYTCPCVFGSTSFFLICSQWMNSLVGELKTSKCVMMGLF